MDKLLNVVVKRSQWLRGEGQSFLLRPNDGKMCCVGFACIAAGLLPEQIKGLTTVAGIANEGSVVPEVLSRGYTTDKYSHATPPAMYRVYQANDRPPYPDAAREANLIELGPTVGINFTFED